MAGCAQPCQRSSLLELAGLLGGAAGPAVLVWSAPLVTPTARRCASCNRFVRAGAKFCDGCGAALLADCPKCGRPLRAGAKFCDNCGAPIRPGS